MCINSWEKEEVNLEAQRDSALLAIQKIIFRIIKLTNDVINKRNNDIFGHRQNGHLSMSGQMDNFQG